MSFDWENAAEVALATALAGYPEVGVGLGAMVYVFWPHSGEDVWSEIREKVEELVDQKLATYTYDRVQDSLKGLRSNLNDYLAAAASKDLDVTGQAWMVAAGDFDQQLPSFQASGYEVVLLPLFAQFANLNLMLLRDGVSAGKSWGWTAAYQDVVRKKLADKIAAYSSYADTTFKKGLEHRIKAVKRDDHLCEPFRTVNRFTREMTLNTLDFKNLWPYLDPVKYPTPVRVYLDREIYSDPVGSCDGSGPIQLPKPPRQLPTQIHVWGGDRIDAIQMTYGDGGGPNGEAQTPRMGNQNGGSDQLPHGTWLWTIGNPIVTAKGRSGDILNSFEFLFRGHQTSGPLAGSSHGNTPDGSPFEFNYRRHVMSSIWINGVSPFYGSADCAVFGFKYDPDWKPDTAALRLLYIGSPAPVTLDQLLARHLLPGHPTVALITESENWKAERQAFWQSVRGSTSSRSVGMPAD
ncbi:hypothetical protein GGC47_005533 [Bosea sp. OAE752]|uniref:insecticidal delta-endotoxin Cry8Ea1 family protein n=1 Tax=Bosea sp. OAE752 TaxID=2663873 RepID=UPI003D19990B